MMSVEDEASTNEETLSEFLEAWVAGEAVDWTRLYKDERPALCPAPSYPFARKRFWFDSEPVTRPASAAEGAPIAGAGGASHELDGGQAAALPGADPESHDNGVPEPRSGSQPRPLVAALPVQTALAKPCRVRLEPLAVSAEPFESASRVSVALGSMDESALRFAAEEALPRTSAPEAGAARDGAAQLAHSALHEERQAGDAKACDLPQPATLERALVESLAQALYMKASDVDVEQPLIDMGLDSIIGVEWVAAINAAYGVSINAVQIYDYPTIRAFSGFLHTQLRQRAGCRATQSSSGPRALVSALDHAAVPAASAERNTCVEQQASARSASTSPEQRPARAEIQGQLITSLAQALYMDPSEVDVEQPFIDMGLDSIIGVEWIHGLNATFGTSLQAIQVYDYPNIKRLSALIEQLSRASTQAPDAAPPGECLPQCERPSSADDQAVASQRETPAAELAARASPPRAKVDNGNAGPAEFGASDVLSGLAGALFKAPDEIDVSRSFAEMGLDPIVVEDWLQRTNRRLGLALEVHAAFQSRSIREFAEDVTRQLAARNGATLPLNGEVGRVLDAPAPVAVPEVTALVAQRPGADVEPRRRPEPIAIVGMSGRYPGASQLEEFWQNLAEGRSSIREVPESRWPTHRYFEAAKPSRPGKIYCKWLGVLSDVDRFDPAFFKISPVEAEEMDPQHRIFLEEAWKAFERAGYPPHALSDANCGVYLGIINQDYRAIGSRCSVTMLEKSNSYAMAAARIAYHLNLKGPAIPIDTACSSSLVAAHLACQALRNGEIDMALVGGVTLYLTPQSFQEMCAAGMLASDGRCRPFDDAADGFTPGEGVGVLVLKRLADAERDRDNILGTIIASGVNQDGRTNGITAPSVTSQAELIRRIYDHFGIDPETIGYVEAHGTGTKLGDPIELTALATAFRAHSTRRGYCAIGSVKSNIGHTSAAAGVAGVHKMLLCMRHGELVPTLNFEVPSRHFDFEASPFRVHTQRVPWPAKGGPRRGAVSAFGFSGTNAHLVIEQYVQHRALPAHDRAVLVPLSAKNPARLKDVASRLLDYLSAARSGSAPGVNLADLAYTLQLGREAMEERLGLLARTSEELEAQLRAFIGRGSAEDCRVGRGTEAAALMALAQDDDFGQLIELWIRKAKHRELLDLWARGVDLDWAKLYAQTPPAALPRRIEAPTYPFARERFWLDNRTAAAELGEIGHLGPLLHENTSSLAEVRFSSAFSGAEFFLRDHRIDADAVLPAAVYLEMAHAAALRAWGVGERLPAEVELENVVWLRPWKASAQLGRVHLRLDSVAEQLASFEIYSDGPGEAGRDAHCRGWLRARAGCEVAPIELRALQARFGAQSPDGVAAGRDSRATLYETFERRGIVYGPSHRAIEELYVGADEVLAKLVLPDEVRTHPQSFTLHPSLLDAALQASAALEPGGASTRLQMLPFALDRLEVFGPIAPEAWAWLRRARSPSSEHAGAGLRVDVDLCRPDGSVCARLRGVTARPTAPRRDEAVLLRQVWKEGDADTLPDSAPAFEGRYVFGCCVPAAERLAACETESRAYPRLSVINLGCGAGIDGIGPLGEVFEAAALALFEHVRRLLQQPGRGRTLVQILVPAGGAGSVLAGLGALLKTAKIEDPSIFGQIVAVDENLSPVQVLAALEREAKRPEVEHVRYDAGRRLVPAFEELPEPALNTPERSKPAVPWKTGGVYLITGGVGQLGSFVADDITSSAAGARATVIVLAGRSPEGEKARALLDQLRRHGARAEYRQLDVSDAAQVSRLVGGIVTEFGALNGVIHCAGVTRDSYITRKTPAEFREVLAAKVGGLVNLEEATRDRGLDFLVAFASAAGVTGNAGQADYAAANAFMSEFMTWRAACTGRGGSHLSIAWPLWRDGGMQVDPVVEASMADRLGAAPLATASGIAALYRSFEAGEPRVLVMNGDVRRILALARDGFPVAGARGPVPRDGARANQGQPIDGASRAVPTAVIDVKRAARSMVEATLSKVLKLPAERLQANARFTDLGIDSIIAIQLTSALEKELGPLPKTLFYEYHDAAALAGYLSDAYGARLLELTQRPDPAANDASARTGAQPTPAPEPAPLRGALEATRAPALPRSRSGDIAIIGISGRYPKAYDVGEYWRNLREGRDCIEEIPEERWDWRMYHSENPDDHGLHNSKAGGFIADVPAFDSLFFNVSPREAKSMDPQERLFLEHVWTALEDAGYKPEDLRRDGAELPGQVGVYVGVMYENYQLLGAEASSQGKSVVAGGSYASIANRVSFVLDLHGPSIAVDTMCSSSLTTIHLACQDLRAGRVHLALAGGVNLSIHPNKYRMLSAGQFLSPRGRCESFGAGGEGYIPGEGVGVLLLKRLAEAERDGDFIYGVIRGSAINHGGRTNGYTVPNPNAQRAVIRGALEDAGVDPRAVSYVEAHGTGTKMGDPIEIAGLSKAYGKRAAGETLWVGSVKSNIGHCEGAAGVAAVTKVLLQLQHGELVPSLHADPLNPNIPWDDTPFTVNRELRPWSRPVVDGKECERISGISSFGAGGSNAHLILSEHVPTAARGDGEPASPQPNHPVLIVLSAKNEERLEHYVRAMRAFVADRCRAASGRAPLRLIDLAYTLQVGRVAMPERLAVVVQTAEELEAALTSVLSAQPAANVLRGRANEAALAAEPEPTLPAGPLRVADLLHVGLRWMAGHCVSWLALYDGLTPRRISAPTYPFARERHWIDAVGGKALAAPLATEGSTQSAVASHEALEAASIRLPARGARTVLQLSAPQQAFGAQEGDVPPPAAASAELAGSAAPARSGQAAGAIRRRTRGDIEAALLSSLARALMTDEAKLEVKQPLSELGLDSIIGVEWIGQINREFGVSLRATDVYDHPSIAELAAWVEQRLAAGTNGRTLHAVSAPDAGERQPESSLRDANAGVSASLLEIERELLASLASALFISPDLLSVDQPFAEMGMDSIVGVEWIKSINERYGTALRATEVYDAPNVASLAARVQHCRGPRSAPVVHAEPARPPAQRAEPPQPMAAASAIGAAAAASVAPAPARERIAIVGMAGKYPGAENLEQYWRNLAAGMSSIQDVPAHRWTAAEHQPRGGRAGRIYCNAIGLLEDVACFDAGFFQILPAEAEEMDPQHRIFLEQGHAALEHMGRAPSSLARKKCGVYLGLMNHDYASIVAESCSPAAGIGSSFAIGAARLPYFLNLKGPAIAVDTACSSSLVAVHLACQALLDHEIELALVGGATLYLTPRSYSAMCAAGMLSPTGQCRAFDDGADGFVPGEGVGALVLKRLSDAERDGDHIWGVILGSGINQDGKTNGITAPSASSQAELIRDVYQKYAIEPDSISYVETHGTGTKLGDPIELTALTTAFREKTQRKGFCALGSVKTNIGHTAAAAGVASIHKVLLCMQHRELVPSLNFVTPNRHFDFEQSPFYVSKVRRAWRSDSATPRRAAVSSFGFSGTNAHLVLEEYVPRAPQAPAVPIAAPALVPISARNPERLKEYARRILEYVAEVRRGEREPVSLHELAAALQSGRDAMEERLGLLSRDYDELTLQLEAFVAGGELLRGTCVARAKRHAPGEALSADTPEVQRWLADGEFMRLIEAWAAGAHLDWDQVQAALGTGRRPRRVPVPTYPFARQHHWIEQAAKPAPAITTAPDAGALALARSRAPVQAGIGASSSPVDGSSVARLDSLTYLPIWEECASQPPQTGARSVRDVQHRTLLIVHRNRSACLADAVRQHHVASPTPPDAIVEIDLERHAYDVVALERALAGVQTVDVVYFVPGCDAARLHVTQTDPTQELEGDEIALLRLLHVLMLKTPAERFVDLYIVTLNNHRIDGGRTNPYGGGVTGVGYAIAQGDHRFRVRNLDVFPEDLSSGPDGLAKAAQLLSLVVAEAPSSRGDLIKLRRGSRYRRVFARLDWPQNDGTSGLKQGGVYVIVGGSGSVGRVITRYLIERYRAAVIWIGRTNESSIRERIEACGAAGAVPFYVQADVTNQTAMNEAVKTIKMRHGKIDGAIFSGMVFDVENAISKTTEAKFREILQVKTRGTRAFYLSLQAESLDFMCFFSSAQAFSFSGAGKLSAYASGTTFSDTFVQSVQPDFPVGIINWGFWQSSLEGTPLASKNVGALADEEGFACFERFVSANLQRNVLRQVACLRAPAEVQRLMNVVEGERVQLSRHRAARTAPWSCDLEPRPPADDVLAEDASIDAWLLKLLLVQMLKISTGRSEDVGLGAMLALIPPARAPGHWRRWWSESLDVLRAAGYIELGSEGARVVRALEAPEAVLWQRWKEQTSGSGHRGWRRKQFALADACLRALPAIASGQVPAEEVLFPGSSLSLVEGMYGDNPRSDLFNAVQAEALVQLVKAELATGRREPLRILEVGAGTGGTTRWLLRALQPYASLIDEYCFTDLSKAFLLHAEESLAADYSFLRAQRFDVEQPLAAQGVLADHYDVVVATNVLHATKSIRNALRNVQACLRAGGLLLLNEISTKSAFAHLTFGLLDGWWRYEDASLRIPGSPGLYPQMWRELLEQEGYRHVDLPAASLQGFGQQVILARSNGVIRQRVTGQMGAPFASSVAPSAPPAPGRSTPPDGVVAQGSDSALKQRVVGEILRALRESLKLEAVIDHHVAFLDYGIDSILGVRFVESIGRNLGISLGTAVLFDHATVDRLANHIVKAYGREIVCGAEPRDEAAGRLEAKLDAGGLPASSPPPLESAGASRTSPTADASSSDIAVIGMAGQFPGASDVNGFWQNLITGKDCVGELPPEVLNEAALDGGTNPSSAAVRGVYRFGGALSGRDHFEPSFFNVAPDDARSMHRHQRLFLQESWKSLEDAGYDPKSLAGSSVAVFVGAEPTGFASSSFMGSSDALIASRLSYFLDLRGAACVVNTGCASSATAIHLACECLRRGEAKLALAGGVFAAIGPETLSTLSAMGMLPASGRCRSFDAAADGTVFSEAVGVVVVKRLADAIADGDAIYGVIKASGVNQGGASNGIMSPNGVAQEELVASLYERFSIDPERIGYLEAHGTGTLLGDAVELNAVARAYRRFTKKTEYCAMGSAKAHIGHTAAAAGVIGLIKILLSMRHGKAPGLLHFRQPNPMLQIAGSAFYINAGSRDWPARPGVPRMAALNSFGHSGTNAHLVVEQYVPPVCAAQPASVREASKRYLVPLSARTGAALKRSAGALAEALSSSAAADAAGGSLRDIVYTLQNGREMMSERVAFLVSDRAELAELLSAFSRGERSERVIERATAGGSDAELRQLAEQWTAGARVHWRGWDGEVPPRRVHLPTYPFAQESYSEPLKTQHAAHPSQDVAPADPAAHEIEAAGAESPAVALVRRVIAEHLSVASDAVPVERSFYDLGLSSSQMVSASQRLRELVDTTLLPSVMLDHPTVRRLAEHVSKAYPERFAQAPAHPQSDTLRTELSTAAEEIATDAEPSQAIGPRPTSERPMHVTPKARVVALLERFERGVLSREDAVALLCKESA